MRPRLSRSALRRLAFIAASVGAGVLMHASASARPVAPRGALSAEERVVIDVFEKSKRSVVYISTSERVRDLWTRNVRSIPRGTGSGFVWDEQGSILTNYHVIAGASEARVRLNDGRDYAATLVGASPFHDLAVLRIKVPSNRPPPLPLGTSHDLRVGQRVYAIGNPFGLDWTLTTGIVSALDRALDSDDGSTIEHLIQTDAAINPGNSGGPLVDSRGNLIGINTAIYSRSGGSIGIGFAIPVSTAKMVLDQIVKTGSVTRGWIGVEVQEISSGLADSFKPADTRGALVAGVLRGGPADKAGFKPGDVLVAVEGKPVVNRAGMLDLVAALTPGSVAQMTVKRGKQDLTLKVAVARRPKPQPKPDE